MNMPPTESANTPETNLEAARKELATLFFQKERNPWVNGIAIGFLPNSLDAIIGAEEQDPAAKRKSQPGKKDILASQPKAPELLVFVNPSAPKCAAKEIDQEVRK